MAKSLLKSENGVQFFEITHDSADVRAYIVKDRLRTPEPWHFNNYGQALAKYVERVENAKHEPAKLPA